MYIMHPWGQTHVFKLCGSPKREVCSAFDRQSPMVGGVIFPMRMLVICGEIHHLRTPKITQRSYQVGSLYPTESCVV